jgi:hypothetical protein
VKSWLAAGHAVQVLNCFTRSEYAPYSDADSVHENDRMSFVTALRKREDECWAKLCGSRLTLTDLRLKDAPIRFHCSLNKVFELPVRSEEKPFAKIRSHVAGCNSALVLPLGIGAHVDHLTAREAALSALDPSRPYAFYEDMPYAALGPASAAGALAEEIGNRVGCELSPAFVREPDALENAMSSKRRFALCYDSQVNDDAVNQIAEFCGHYAGRERLWANEAWRTILPAA